MWYFSNRATKFKNGQGCQILLVHLYVNSPLPLFKKIEILAKQPIWFLLFGLLLLSPVKLHQKIKEVLSKALPHLLQLSRLAVFLLGKHQVHFTHVIV